jgi:mannitol-1-phosphate 5-dehydrogenase
MIQKKSLLIYGAGAIGRGYIPWVFSPDEYRFFYVEKNDEIRSLLNEQKTFTTYKTLEDGYEARLVEIETCFAPGQEKDLIQSVDAVITAVGPRNILPLLEVLHTASGPIICFENDKSIPDFINSVTKKDNAVFGIPDVITSSTAPVNLKKKDKLAITTEDGTCFIDEAASNLGGKCSYIDKNELNKQWIAKLYLHNTTHCIAAYLGYLIGSEYIHQSMMNLEVKKIVTEAMHEMQDAIKIRFDLDETFVDWYANKEIKRFCNKLLFDPVSRVAREPFRKLARGERLIGAAELCLTGNIAPQHILIGIMAAFLYRNPTDPDAHIRHLVTAMKPEDFLYIIMGFKEHDVLFNVLINNWKKNIELLKGLK